MNVFLGIDWGGTYIKAGIVDSGGKLIKKVIYNSQKLSEKNSFIHEIESLVNQFKEFNIQAIGIGVPGILDIDKGFIYFLPNISGWEDYPLKDILQKKLKLPVFIDNDANVFALAESRCGAGKGKSRGIFLTLGTGLGGAIIVHNKILTGKTSSGELGHVPISLNGRRCGCGGKGCIETYVGNSYLLKRYRKLKNNKTKVKDIKEIFQKGLGGEKEALIVWKEFSHALGKFLSGMINIFNPEVIIFGGGVSGAFRLFKPYVWQVIKQQAIQTQLNGLKLVKAKLKDPGIIGAALLAAESKIIRKKVEG